MPQINIKPEIIEIDLSAIKPFVNNPRDISSEAIQGLRSSLEKFGYIDLLVVNKRNMEIIAGHQRYKVLCDEGAQKIPCIVVDVDEMMQQTMNITLNNQAIAGYWTQAIIPILEKLRQETPEDYIELHLQELREECEKLESDQVGHTLPDDIPPAPKEAITKLGDLWILGQHRLLCGSSTNEADVLKLMDGQKAQLLATDPPYMVDYTGADRPNGGKDWSNLYHEVDIPNAENFYRDFYSIAIKVIDQDSALYLWHADRRLVLIRKIWEDLGLLVHQHIIWVKPTEIFAIPMRVHTKPGDICFEPFSGSGSQIIAAERLNRKCFAMELEPVFCDVAVRRWEEFTGKKAELIKGEDA